MPITTTIDHRRKLTIFTVTGALPFEEGMEALAQFYDNEPTMNALWDFSEASLIRITYVELQKIIDYVSTQAQKRIGGTSILVGSEDLEFGTIRLLKTFGEIKALPFQIVIFRTIEAAYQWLDAEEES